MGTEVRQRLAKRDSLRTYRQKRDFRKTSEPSGRGKGSRSSKGKPRFVVQQHDATTEHYDFRLEVGGVLKSWAVPKGLSTNPRVKRLAVPTEDHPLDYIDFEGVIPEGEYGAGAVIVWDRGTYRNLKDDISLEKAFQDGHATIWLEGEKLQGSFALIRTDAPKKGNWLIVKMLDKKTDGHSGKSYDNKSVLSGRTVRQVGRKES